LRGRYPYAAIDVLSADPEQTAHELRIEATPRAKAGAVRAAIDRADVVLSGGGGLLQNATSLRSLVYYAGILRAAIRGERKTMIFAQSVGPLDFFGKAVVRDLCKGVSRATVRDARSAALLRELLKGTPVEQTADPVFLYEPPQTSDDLARHGIEENGVPLVVVCVRPSQRVNEGARVIARAVDRIEATGAQVVFLPLGGVPDAEVSTAVIRRCKSSPALLPVSSLEEAASILRGAHAVIGMRLHALIFAIRYAVPFLAIPYDPKVSSLCEDIDYPIAPLWVPGAKKAPDDAQIDELVDRFFAEHGALREALMQTGPRMRALAARNFEVLDELVRE